MHRVVHQVGEKVRLTPVFWELQPGGGTSQTKVNPNPLTNLLSHPVLENMCLLTKLTKQLYNCDKYP